MKSSELGLSAMYRILKKSGAERVSDESANERIVDLLQFAVSPEYRALRQVLCLAIPTPDLPTQEHDSVVALEAEELQETQVNYLQQVCLALD